MAETSGSNSEGLTRSSILSHLGVMVAISAVMGLLVAGLAVPYVTALGSTSQQAAAGLSQLPKELAAAPLAQKSRLLASNGRVIATFYSTDQNRTSVTFDEISPHMRRAIIAIEDYRFYEHGALDLKGTLRAFLTNASSGGAVVQGGSSITQQMAKMTQLNQAQTAAERKAATADTYARKILELRHSIAFEENYSKDWILTRYLNLAYFGDGVYGIQAAARHYFSRDAKNLTVKQSALLAGLVKNPVGYDPTDNADAAKARRQIVLNRMAELGIISAQRAKNIGAQDLGLKVTPTRNGCVSSVAPFFCDYAYRYLLEDPSLGRTRDERRQLINNGGLTIKSTIDLRYQKAAREAVTSHVNPTDQAIGAIAEVEPGTGNVKAVAQSRPMGRNRDLGQTYLNYVVPADLGDSGGFQAGSTFKAFVLASALEQGQSPYTGISSPNTIGLNQGSFPTCEGNYASSDIWQVGNSTSGPASANMYTGTQLSINTYYAQLEMRTGLCEPYALAKKMGIQLTDPARERVPSFTLGVASVSPMEMAEAYATFAARGKHCAAKPVTEILNSEGKVFKKYAPQCKQVLQETTADRVNDILRGVMVGNGFGAGLALPGRVSAGKTGTIQNNAAVWFMGYTPSLATAAMVAGANSEGSPITLNGQTVGGRYISSAFGSTVAGPMWSDALRPVAEIMPALDFTRPGGFALPTAPQVAATPAPAPTPAPAAPVSAAPAQPAPQPNPTPQPQGRDGRGNGNGNGGGNGFGGGGGGGGVNR